MNTQKSFETFKQEFYALLTASILGICVGVAITIGFSVWVGIAIFIMSLMGALTALLRVVERTNEEEFR